MHQTTIYFSGSLPGVIFALHSQPNGHLAMSGWNFWWSQLGGTTDI